MKKWMNMLMLLSLSLNSVSPVFAAGIDGIEERGEETSVIAESETTTTTNSEEALTSASETPETPAISPDIASVEASETVDSTNEESSEEIVKENSLTLFSKSEIAWKKMKKQVNIYCLSMVN
ncbi:hypothetical protein M2139_001459 [Enterococcus sp. PF1-24]|uniref:hypothetical protein n=1 Tax=unclassified Enterococcus TaxID=2608891 RepID=UPI00247418DB|nr:MULTISPECIES: hypothetical protein [unclassified Enterococcus]MDH6364402.1 hypothetical protein [Enterococcus sp. PFB1-1]MDH6401575.1 hypothetical protein [Enterococcus sp. PF1-24]